MPSHCSCLPWQDVAHLKEVLHPPSIFSQILHVEGVAGIGWIGTQNCGREGNLEAAQTQQVREIHSPDTARQQGASGSRQAWVPMTLRRVYLRVCRQVHCTSRTYPAQRWAEAARKSMHMWKGHFLGPRQLSTNCPPWRSVFSSSVANVHLASRSLQIAIGMQNAESARLRLAHLVVQQRLRNVVRSF